MNQIDKGVTSLVKVSDHILINVSRQHISLIQVLGNSGEKLFATFIRDLSASERTWLFPAVYGHTVSMLRKTRDSGSVEKAIGCFTIAILCCSEDPAYSAGS